MLEIKFKKLSKNAVIPTKSNPSDAGFDLTAIHMVPSPASNIIEYFTGIAVEIPPGYVGLIFPRSSIYKQDLDLSNSVGVIDSGYRGEIRFKFRITGEGWWSKYKRYDINDRIGQLIIMPYPEIKFVEVDELSDSERGTNGFGSSGK